MATSTLQPNPAKIPVNEVGWIVIDLANALERPCLQEDFTFANSMRDGQIWLRAKQVAPNGDNRALPRVAWSVVHHDKPFAARQSHFWRLCGNHGSAHEAEAGSLLVHGQHYLAEHYIALWRSVMPMPLDLLQLRGLAIKAKVSLDTEMVTQRCARSSNHVTRSVLQSAAITHRDHQGSTTWEFEIDTLKAVRLAHELHELGQEDGEPPSWTFDVIDVGVCTQRPLEFDGTQPQERAIYRGESLSLFEGTSA